MLDIKKVKSVYIATVATDLRRGIDGLSMILQEEFKLDPFSSSLFVFCNKNKDKLNSLRWNYSGFWLYNRRLEKGKFKWPFDDSDTIKIDLNDLKWLLYGYELRCGNYMAESNKDQLYNENLIILPFKY